MRRYNLHVSDVLWHRIERIAEALELSYVEVIRRALEGGLGDLEDIYRDTLAKGDR